MKIGVKISWKIIIICVSLILVSLLVSFYIPVVYRGPGFSFQYQRFSDVTYEQIGDNPLNEAGAVVVEGKGHQLKLTYIHDVEEADPVGITREFVSFLETRGVISNQSEIIAEEYNDIMFYTVYVVFSDGVEKVYLIYSIHYNAERKSLYYFLCSSKENEPFKIMGKYLNSFYIR